MNARMIFVAVVPVLFLWGQSSVVDGKIVYSNNFDSGNASLSDFIVEGQEPYSVDVVSGQLEITTGVLGGRGYAAIHESKFLAPYSSTLKDNPGLVSWSFNVSNENGEFNNKFYFVLASDVPDAIVYTSTAYIFQGGGYVGHRMMLHRHSGPGHNISIIDITDGLPNLPYKGSFRITYDPSTGRWSLYGITRGLSYADPAGVSELLGSKVDDTYTDLDLPYMSLGGSTTGSDYFDNVTVSVFAGQLSGLEITGPDEVADDFSTSYKALAHYDDDSTRDVTALASWAAEPEATASIEAGMLTTKDIINDESATIWAGYTEGDVTFEAEKIVNIFPICTIGTALSFDGADDYVEIGPGVVPVGEKSIFSWVKMPPVGQCSRVSCDYIIYHGRDSDIGGAVLYFNNGVELRWLNTHSGGFDAKHTVAIDNNQWHFVGIAYDGGVHRLYLDGNEIASSTGDDHSTIIAYEGIGGFYGDLSSRGWYGTIDEVAIYNRALSGEEIQANMHRRLAGDELGLVGYWDFDEGVGQIVYDLSGNGNDGLLGSTPDADASDPAWIESDAPIGRCTPYLIATAAAKEALKHKKASLKELEAALAKEWTMYEALEQWLESGDFADLSKGDIVKAKQKTHSAMQHEEQSIDVMEKGIEKLLDSLIALGYGPQPPGSNWPPNVTIIKPQNGAEFNYDDTIVIEADAWDFDGSVVMVEFFAGGSKIGEDNDGADGWTTNWYDHPEGTYNLTAKATDDDGAATTSQAVEIIVVILPPPPPPPPGPPPVP